MKHTRGNCESMVLWALYDSDKGKWLTQAQIKDYDPIWDGRTIAGALRALSNRNLIHKESNVPSDSAYNLYSLTYETENLMNYFIAGGHLWR